MLFIPVQSTNEILGVNRQIMDSNFGVACNLWNHRTFIEGESGDFHCADCSFICNYNNNCYCCDAAEEKPLLIKKRDSFFLSMCYIQTAVKRLVDAMTASKYITDKEGDCYFCHNKAQHENKWCSEKSMFQLYEIAYAKEQRKVEMFLEKFLAARRSVHIKEVERSLEIGTVQMKKLVNDNPRDYTLRLKLIRHGRNVRQTIKEQEAYIDKENADVRRRLMESFQVKKNEELQRLYDHSKLCGVNSYGLILNFSKMRTDNPYV